jgi:hypothetical protein
MSDIGMVSPQFHWADFAEPMVNGGLNRGFAIKPPFTLTMLALSGKGVKIALGL